MADDETEKMKWASWHYPTTTVAPPVEVVRVPPLVVVYPLRRLVYEQLANISCGNGTMRDVRFCRFNSLFTGDFFAALSSFTGALSRCASIVHGQVLQKKRG